jgi:DNA-binding CsgD family transcriptional regulator
MPSVLISPRCPDRDDPDVRRLLELIAGLTGASWIELEVRPDGGEPRSYRRGPSGDRFSAVSLDLGRYRAELRVGGVEEVDGKVQRVVSFSLQQLLRCLRIADQVTLLQGALEETSNAVLLFDSSGDIVYANPPADRLLSRQTEDDLEVESSGQRPQPMFMRIWSMVEMVLDGRATQLPWTSTLVLSDGSVLVCEIIRVDLAATDDRVGILALLQPLPALPSLFLDAFCARHRISPRERDVIGLLLEGLGTAEMADRLAISEHTVRDHLKSLYRKTGTKSRSELLSVVSTARMEPANGARRHGAAS